GFAQDGRAGVHGEVDGIEDADQHAGQAAVEDRVAESSTGPRRVVVGRVRHVVAALLTGVGVVRLPDRTPGGAGGPGGPPARGAPGERKGEGDARGRRAEAAPPRPGRREPVEPVLAHEGPTCLKYAVTRPSSLKLVRSCLTIAAVAASTFGLPGARHTLARAFQASACAPSPARRCRLSPAGKLTGARSRWMSSSRAAIFSHWSAALRTDSLTFPFAG